MLRRCLGSRLPWRCLLEGLRGVHSFSPSSCPAKASSWPACSSLSSWRDQGPLRLGRRWYSPGGGQGEKKIKEMLTKAFPGADTILVEDISGGCGSMYQVLVQSKEFQGLSIIKQHQLVNKALKEEIKDMHGIRIHTKVP